uniref:Uncharacterized protein n=1 Tax=viral metagenome TaxID=1070528 RepID=A0A6M3J0M5_9ZZZZ
MNEFKQYQRRGLSEMRSYIKGEDLTGISVSDTDTPETDMGMIARNPKNHEDRWYVAKKYFEDNLIEVENYPHNIEAQSSELLEIYRMLLCPAKVTPCKEGDSYIIELLKGIIHRWHDAEKELLGQERDDIASGKAAIGRRTR